MSKSNPKCFCCQTTASDTYATLCIHCMNFLTRIKSAQTIPTKCDCCQLSHESVLLAEYQCKDKYYLCDPCHSQHLACPAHKGRYEMPATLGQRSPMEPADAAPSIPQHHVKNIPEIVSTILGTSSVTISAEISVWEINSATAVTPPTGQLPNNRLMFVSTVCYGQHETQTQIVMEVVIAAI
ncbi:hypothetical protein EMCRGX_G008775 [Ephydatia muelleri]